MISVCENTNAYVDATQPNQKDTHTQKKLIDLLDNTILQARIATSVNESNGIISQIGAFFERAKHANPRKSIAVCYA